MRLFALDEEAVVTPEGLEYHPDFLQPAEESELLARIDGAEWLAEISRRVLHFGYKYDYSSRSLDESARIGPLPEWLDRLAHKIHEAASSEARQLLSPSQAFEQAIVNEYLPGQGIAPHVDRDCFGPVIATVSLGSAINMDFCCDETGESHVQRLEPRSLVLMHGDARSTWRHGIAKRRTDIWDGRKVPRQRRVSITLRTIADLSLAPA